MNLFERLRRAAPAGLRTHRGRLALLAIVALVPAAAASLAPDDTTSGSPDAATSASPTPEDSPSPSSESGGTIAGGTGGLSNVVVIVNTVDGLHRSRAGHGTARVLADSVNNTNAAAATSSCNGCRTVAVATQVVLIMGDASSVTPQNYALAINQNCQSCQTMAAAYQYVITTDGMVRFTAAGEARLAQLRNQIEAVTDSGLPFPELRAQLDALVDEMWAVVDSELVSIGKPFDASPRRDVEIETSPAEPDVQDDPPDAPDGEGGGSTPEPTSSPTPSPSPSPSDEDPSPSPSP